MWCLMKIKAVPLRFQLGNSSISVQKVTPEQRMMFV